MREQIENTGTILEEKMKLIAETSWHHEGDFNFMKDLLRALINSKVDIIKMHITLDFDEYMDKSHPLYKDLKKWLFSEEEWKELIDTVKKGGKELLLLLNDTKSVELAKEIRPQYIEVHSVCLNDIFLLEKIKEFLKENPNTKIVIGVGGTTLEEIDFAISYLNTENIILMFGFQNYPTRYEDINTKKIKKIMSLYPRFEYGYADHTSWDHPYNELITLLVASLGMNYIEKHATIKYGEKRTDYVAAVSIKMLNSLREKMEILEKLQGTGSLLLNEGERKYSIYGFMKKAPILIKNVKKGEKLDYTNFRFKRTGKNTDLSQVDTILSIGKTFKRDLPKGYVLKKDDLE